MLINTQVSIARLQLYQHKPNLNRLIYKPSLEANPRYHLISRVKTVKDQTAFLVHLGALPSTVSGTAPSRFRTYVYETQSLIVRRQPGLLRFLLFPHSVGHSASWHS